MAPLTLDIPAAAPASRRGRGQPTTAPGAAPAARREREHFPSAAGASAPAARAERDRDAPAGAPAGLMARPSLLDRILEERRRESGEPDDRSRRAPAEPAPAAPPADERSLDALVSAAWSAVTSSEAAACLVCGGELVPRYGAGARPVAARCRDCGTDLA